MAKVYYINRKRQTKTENTIIPQMFPETGTTGFSERTWETKQEQ